MSLGQNTSSHDLISKNDVYNAKIDLNKYLDKDMVYYIRPTDTGYGTIQLEETLPQASPAIYTNANSITSSNTNVLLGTFNPIDFTQAFNGKSSSGFTSVTDNNTWRYDLTDNRVVNCNLSLPSINCNPPVTTTLTFALYKNGSDTGQRASILSNPTGGISGFNCSFVESISQNDELRWHVAGSIPTIMTANGYNSTITGI